MHNKLTTWILLIICLVLFINLVRSWVHLASRGDIIREAREKQVEVRNLYEDLKRQLARAQSQEYIEREARDKLNLGKEGEMVVILPPITPLVYPTPTPIDDSPNWQKWVRVFF